jgi:FkbM family methyltransferase
MKTYSNLHGYWMLLDTSETIQYLMSEQAYEPIETSWVSNFLNPGMNFVDIGANFGWYTTLALQKVGKAGKVFGYEPGIQAFNSISLNLSKVDNLVLKNVAVGRTNGEISLYIPTTGDLYSPSSFYQFGNFEKVMVPMIKLDDDAELNQCEYIDFVKMDIEGSEPDALAGMENLIKNNKVGRVLCEFNEFWLLQNGYNFEKLLLDFINYGFSIETASDLAIIDTNEGGKSKLQNILFVHSSVR